MKHSVISALVVTSAASIRAFSAINPIPRIQTHGSNALHYQRKSSARVPAARESEHLLRTTTTRRRRQPVQRERSRCNGYHALPDDTLDDGKDLSPGVTNDAGLGAESSSMTTGNVLEDDEGGGVREKREDGQYVAQLRKRLSDMFPLLSPDEMRMLLQPEDSKSKPGGSLSREDHLGQLIKDVREMVGALMLRVGATDAKALVELGEMTETFKGLLRGDPASVEELRSRVLRDLEEVQEEIEELLEVEELAKARAKLEKATTESTELVLDYTARALATGLDRVMTGHDAIKEGEQTETLQVSTYVFGGENEFWEDMRRNGVSPRRFFLYQLLGIGVALGGNLFGVTSGLLGVAPGVSRDLRLDVLYPISGFKRFVSPEDGYEFIYPQQWVGDTGLALRQQRDLENAREESAMVTRARQRRAGRSALSPAVGFGPQGGDGTQNVSVVKSQVMRGFSLRGTLGEPREAAEKILSTIIAPEGSGKEWELLDAFGEERGAGGLVYQFEYRVQGKGIKRPLRNIGVVANRGATLFTVTVLAPAESWEGGRGEQYGQMARSFRLTN